MSYTFYSDYKYEIELSNLKAEEVERFKETEMRIFSEKKDREGNYVGEYVDIDILNKKLNTIFFSNVFDNSREAEVEENQNYISISTNYLLRNIKKSNDAFDRRNHIDIFQNEEFNRQFYFVKQSLENKFRNLKMSKFVEIPTHIKVEVITKGDIFLDRHRSQQKEIFQKIISEYIHGKIIKIEDINFENSVLTNCIENYFQEIRDEKRILLKKQEYDLDGKNIADDIVKDIESNWQNFNSNNKGFELCKDILKCLDRDLDIIINYKDKSSSINIDNIKKQKKIIKNNIELIKEIKNIYYSKNQNNGKEDFIIDFGKFIKIFELYKESYREDGFLIFNWAYDIRTLSSGENAMLNLFSRFYWVYASWNNSHYVEGETILILMDEPEEYLHPEWQRNFINILIDFLQNIFINFKIQIIITSNSPYLISDMPKENVVFIENNSICDNYKFNRTFGANIHTLLTNSFFMKNTIGEFANQKIKDSLKIMDKYKKSKDSNIEESEFKKEYIKYMGCKENEEVSIEKMEKKIKYIIEIIGEPLIKRKLEEIYRTTFKKDKKYYESEIKKLQQEKVKLQQIIKDEGLDTINGVMGLLDEKIKELEKRAGDRI